MDWLTVQTKRFHIKLFSSNHRQIGTNPIRQTINLAALYSEGNGTMQALKAAWAREPVVCFSIALGTIGK